MQLNGRTAACRSKAGPALYPGGSGTPRGLSRVKAAQAFLGFAMSGAGGWTIAVGRYGCGKENLVGLCNVSSDPPLEDTDLHGKWRIADGEGDGSATVEMGAYEYRGQRTMLTGKRPRRSIVPEEKGRLCLLDGSAGFRTDMCLNKGVRHHGQPG